MSSLSALSLIFSHFILWKWCQNNPKHMILEISSKKLSLSHRAVLAPALQLMLWHLHLLEHERHTLKSIKQGHSSLLFDLDRNAHWGTVYKTDRCVLLKIYEKNVKNNRHWHLVDFSMWVKGILVQVYYSFNSGYVYMKRGLRKLKWTDILKVLCLKKSAQFLIMHSISKFFTGMSLISQLSGGKLSLWCEKHQLFAV